jgi:RNA polymerase sigma factor (sigma-70 family)
MTCPVTQESDRLAALLKILEPQLRALLWRYRVPEMDAQDLIHDAVLAMLSRELQIADPRNWLFIAARNQCVSYLRRRHCWSRLVDAMDPERLQLLAPLVEPPQRAAEIDHDVHCILAKLAESDRTLLTLRYIEGLGPTEIAAQIGCHPGSVRKATLRALSRIQDALGLSVEVDQSRNSSR